MTRPLLILGSFALLSACGDKNTDPAPPPVGWHAEEGWSGQCWFPPDFDGLQSTEGTSARRMARQESLEQMKTQWSGAREDGVSFPSNVVEDIETVLLGRPEAIETVAQKNLGFCKAVMVGGATQEWQSWLGKLPDQLTEGECLAPLMDTWFNYLDIGLSWQFSVPVCANDVAVITASEKDRYRIENGGDWMNANGLPGTMGTDPELHPCTLESCAQGMLIGRFVSDEGVEELFPVGTGTSFRAPAHGTISFTINDTSYYDNVYYKSGGIIEATAITVSPEQ